MSPTVLQVLSQRPLLTGSGVIADVFARQAALKGWDQHVVVGLPAGEETPSVGGLDPGRTHPLFFGRGDLDFPLPGMSDVMPYVSTRFSDMSESQIAAYKNAWKKHLAEVISAVRPDIIHAHHIWILSSLIKDISPKTPVVNQCHATDLRQMVLCPHLKEDVVEGCRGNERFVVAYQGQADELSRVLKVPPERVRVIGAGYNEDLFHAQGRTPQGRQSLLYAGKLSRAKGVPWLLDAVQRLLEKGIDLELHIAGGGSGEEADEIKARISSMTCGVVYHGRLDQPELARLMRKCAAFALPSFYEAVPLVLVEALACGCRLVSTSLPGVQSELEPRMSEAIDIVPLPSLIGADVPDPADLGRFTADLAAAIETAVSKPPVNFGSGFYANALEPFKWSAIFERVQAVWRESLEG